MKRSIFLKEKGKISYGLALSGGGARGAAHAGVLLALKEEGLLPSAISGASAGSIVAGCFACKMEPEEICEAVREAGKRGACLLDPDCCRIFKLLPQLLLHQNVSLQGLLKGERLKNWLCRMTEGKLLSEAGIPLLIPSVDLKSGKTVCFIKGLQPSVWDGGNSSKSGREIIWLTEGKIADIMTASSSVPGIFAPQKMGEYLLVDGGITDNLPAALLSACGIEQVVAVDIAAAYHMPEKSSVFEILSHSFSVMSENLKKCRSEEEWFLLKPELPKDAGLFSFDRMEACMEEGYRSAKENAGQLRKAVEVSGH